jgi:hypothetical protein
VEFNQLQSFGSDVLLRYFASAGPYGFCLIVASATKQLYPKFIFHFWGPVASRLNPSFFTFRAPRIRMRAAQFRRPVKTNWNPSPQGLQNVPADESFFLPTMHVAIDLL